MQAHKGVESMMTQKTKKKIRNMRVLRTRSQMEGTAKRPRLSIFRSNTSLEAQVVDDVKKETIVSIVVRQKNIRGGEILAGRICEELKKRNIQSVVFDRRGNKFHGVIQKIADGIREGGIRV